MNDNINLEEEYNKICKLQYPYNTNEFITSPSSKCLGLFIFSTVDNTYTNNKYKKLISTLLKFKSLIYLYYPSGYSTTTPTLHHTINTLSTFETFENIIVKYLCNHDIYDNIIKKCIKYHFDCRYVNVIELRGYIITENAIILKGYPNLDFNRFRKHFKNMLNHSGLEWNERYDNKIIHLTLCRFKTANISNLIGELGATETFDLYGYIVIDNIVLGCGTWLCEYNDVDILCKYRL